jgi:hypothetical protein
MMGLKDVIRRRIGGLVIGAILASPLAAQQLPQQPNAIRQRLSQPQGAPAQSSAPAAKPSPAPAPKPAAALATASKPASASSSRPAPAAVKPTSAATVKSAPATAKPAAAALNKPAKAAPELKQAARRDPFDPLVGKQKSGPAIPTNLPPGKAGLMIATLNIDGVVRGPGGMIAIVSNPQMRVYFLHQGDQLYDGQVGNISMEAVSFHQAGKDPFGASVERDITRRLYPTPGEQP